MLNDLLLLSGNDIPFVEGQLIIHQPTCKEIALIGEENFFAGCELLRFSKDILTEEDKNNLENKTNFDILIAILGERNAVMQKNRNCVLMVLALIFPQYEIILKNNCIELKKDEEKHYINNNNFESFKKIISQMFAYKNEESSADQTQLGEMAKRIEEKLKKRHQKLAEIKDTDKKKIDIISRYISILSVGEKKDMNLLLNYTLYQLFDEFKRYELKVGYDLYIQAKMAGAKDLKEVDDWMQDIHS